MYFYVDFVTPGKNYFVVKYNEEQIQIEDTDEEKNTTRPIIGMFANAFSPTKKKRLQKKDFYVHELLAGFRHEDIPKRKCFYL